SAFSLSHLKKSSQFSSFSVSASRDTLILLAFLPGSSIHSSCSPISFSIASFWLARMANSVFSLGIYSSQPTLLSCVFIVKLKCATELPIARLYHCCGRGLWVRRVVFVLARDSLNLLQKSNCRALVSDGCAPAVDVLTAFVQSFGFEMI